MDDLEHQIRRHVDATARPIPMEEVVRRAGRLGRQRRAASRLLVAAVVVCVLGVVGAVAADDADLVDVGAGEEATTSTSPTTQPTTTSASPTTTSETSTTLAEPTTTTTTTTKTPPTTTTTTAVAFAPLPDLSPTRVAGPACPGLVSDVRWADGGTARRRAPAGTSLDVVETTRNDGSESCTYEVTPCPVRTGLLRTPDGADAPRLEFPIACPAVLQMVTLEPGESREEAVRAELHVAPGTYVVVVRAPDGREHRLGVDADASVAACGADGIAARSVSSPVSLFVRDDDAWFQVSVATAPPAPCTLRLGGVRVRLPDRGVDSTDDLRRVDATPGATLPRAWVAVGPGTDHPERLQLDVTVSGLAGVPEGVHAGVVTVLDEGGDRSYEESFEVVRG